MPLSRANPPIYQVRRKVQTRRTWPRARMILGHAGSKAYSDKVLETEPFAYWPLWEASGTVAECLTGSSFNGTYSSDVSGWSPGEGIGDGHTAPLFVERYVDILTSALQSAFDGDEGTAMIWEQVYNAGVWTDGEIRVAMSLWADDNNQVQLSKTSNNNELWFRYFAGATEEDMREYSISATAWYQHVITWSKSNDRVRAYRDAVLVDSDTGLGVWSGTLASLATRIGCLTTTVTSNDWYGRLAHAAIWDEELPQAAIGSIR